MDKYVGSLIRHGFQFLGGFLVMRGLAEPEVADKAAQANAELVVGVVTSFGSLGFSFWDKLKKRF